MKVRTMEIRLTAKEAEALAEAINFRMAGDTSDIPRQDWEALNRAALKLNSARLR